MPDKKASCDVILNKRGKLIDIKWKSSNVKWKKGKIGKITGKVSYHIPNKKGMGRNKGNNLERETALILSLWIYGEPGILKRTPLSGGWASGKAGDVILDHELERKGYWQPPIYVECRSYKDLLQHNFLTWIDCGVPKTLTPWIEEVEQKCDGRLPMLVLKGNGTDPYLLMKQDWCTMDGMRYEFTRQKGSVDFSGPDGWRYILLPLMRIGQLGDGEILLKNWRGDGGPARLKKYIRSIRGRQSKED